jgi:hypothetical protein
MKRLLLTILLLLSIASTSIAEQIEIRHVSELIKPADVIARVTILSVRETGAMEGYSKIASAQVTDSIKGLEGGSVFELENDAANMICPNVRYLEGEDVLIFAKKMANGHYETLYADAGKFLIGEGAISKQPFREGQSYDSARAEIEGEMRKIEKGQH